LQLRGAGGGEKWHWTFEEAIENKVFTVIGKGNIDFPAFFSDVD